ncbi:hypothetical protein SDJN03_17375, partial [Cucurbita argyrosperma subsp. sororia]
MFSFWRNEIVSLSLVAWASAAIGLYAFLVALLCFFCSSNALTTALLPPFFDYLLESTTVPLSRASTICSIPCCSEAPVAFFLLFWIPHLIFFDSYRAAKVDPSIDESHGCHN